MYVRLTRLLQRTRKHRFLAAEQQTRSAASANVLRRMSVEADQECLGLTSEKKLSPRAEGDVRQVSLTRATAVATAFFQEEVLPRMQTVVESAKGAGLQATLHQGGFSTVPRLQ